MTGAARVHSPGMRGTGVRATGVPGAAFAGGAPAFVATPAVRDRALDHAAIRRRLPSRPTLARDALVDGVFDESGSMWFGNDTVRLRREAFLVALEHLAPGGGRRGRWSARITSFDTGGPLELPATRLDRHGLRAAERVLLADHPGTSSVLGGALAAVEAAAFDGDRLLVVFSDFELYDPDPRRVVARLITSTAQVVLAVVFRSPPPPQFDGTRARVVLVEESSSPTDIARAVVEAAAVLDAPEDGARGRRPR